MIRRQRFTFVNYSPQCRISWIHSVRVLTPETSVSEGFNAWVIWYWTEICSTSAKTFSISCGFQVEMMMISKAADRSMSIAEQRRPCSSWQQAAVPGCVWGGRIVGPGTPVARGTVEIRWTKCQETCRSHQRHCFLSVRKLSGLHSSI